MELMKQEYLLQVIFGMILQDKGRYGNALDPQQLGDKDDLKTMEQIGI